MLLSRPHSYTTIWLYPSLGRPPSLSSVRVMKYLTFDFATLVCTFFFSSRIRYSRGEGSFAPINNQIEVSSNARFQDDEERLEETVAREYVDLFKTRR